MKKDFLYRTIANQIRNAIQKDEFNATNQLPTTVELSEAYNTSPMTIHKALNILVEDGFIKRIPGKGTFVDKQRHVEHYSNEKRSGIIGAIVYDASEHFLWSIALKGMMDALQENNYNLLIGNNDGDFEKAEKYIHDFSQRNIDGLILVPIGHPSEADYEAKNTKLVKLVESIGIPYILFHRYLTTKETNVVALDDYRNTLTLMSYFLKRKIKHPICLSHYYTTCTDLREKAFIQALVDLNFPNPVNNIKRIFSSGQKTDARVADSIIKILKADDAIDGIFAVENDILSVTMSIIEADEQLRSRHICFSCFDYSNTINLNDVTDIMDVPTYDLGFCAGETILKNIQSTNKFTSKILLSSSLRKR